MFLLVLLDACCSSQLSMQTKMSVWFLNRYYCVSGGGSPETWMVQPISGSEFITGGSEFITGGSPWWQRVLLYVFESKQMDSFVRRLTMYPAAMLHRVIGSGEFYRILVGSWGNFAVN